jgi:hypothetical protein
MSFTQTTTTQAKYVALNYLATGTLKIALYTAEAGLDASTTVYTTTGEVTGAGYSAGGKTLTGVTVSQSGVTAYLDFDDVTWDPAVFTARGALIYNASIGNLAIAVLDFGSDKTATTLFTVQMPPNTATSALVRLSN